MKILAWVVAVWFMIAGSVFINGKLRNDSNIARDTERIADALSGIEITIEPKLKRDQKVFVTYRSSSNP